MQQQPLAPADASGAADNRLDPRHLTELLHADDVDAAIEAGLMRFVDDGDAGLDEASRALLADTRQRLHAAWAARERHRGRQARIARRKAARDARRVPQPQPQPEAAARPALPAAAAAALARARARAGG